MANTGLNGGGTSPDAIRRQTERILASETFAGSERLSRFLRFAVETTLQGQGDQIKEYLVGREVFDRSDDYDPRLDPIVRVEARRLRSKLDEYYAGPGRQDRLRIQFRKGSYAPFVEVADEASPGPGVPAAPSRRWIIAGAGVAIVLVVGALILSRPAPSGQRIAVAPASWLQWNASEPNAFEESLVERLTADLAGRSAIQVVSWPSVLPYKGARKTVEEIAAQLRAPQIAIISGRAEGDEVRVWLHLVEGSSGRKEWAAEYRRRLHDPAGTQAELARVIGEELTAHLRNQSNR